MDGVFDALLVVIIASVGVVNCITAEFVQSAWGGGMENLALAMVEWCMALDGVRKRDTIGEPEDVTIRMLVMLLYKNPTTSDNSTSRQWPRFSNTSFPL